MVWSTAETPSTGYKNMEPVNVEGSALRMPDPVRVMGSPSLGTGRKMIVSTLNEHGGLRASDKPLSHFKMCPIRFPRCIKSLYQGFNRDRSKRQGEEMIVDSKQETVSKTDRDERSSKDRERFLHAAPAIHSL